MPRSARIEGADLVHHVTARGNAGAEIFFGRPDYEVFLRRLAEVIGERDWICLAYCLLPNHYHLLLETPRANLGAGMQRLNTAHAVAFAQAHGLAGHVFQGRFHSRPIHDDRHLREAVRYIALNPVRAGLCRSPQGWQWSSYASVDRRRPDSTVATRRLLALFDGSLDELREFVDEGLLLDQERTRPSLAELVDRVDAPSIAHAHRDHGYSLRAIARHLGVSPPTVLRALRRNNGV